MLLLYIGFEFPFAMLKHFHFLFCSFSLFVFCFFFRCTLPTISLGEFKIKQFAIYATVSMCVCVGVSVFACVQFIQLMIYLFHSQYSVECLNDCFLHSQNVLCSFLSSVLLLLLHFLLVFTTLNFAFHFRFRLFLFLFHLHRYGFQSFHIYTKKFVKVFKITKRENKYLMSASKFKYE